MNRSHKFILGIAAGALIGLGLLSSRSPTPGMEMGASGGETRQEPDKTPQRRARKGPRTPPRKTVLSPAISPGEVNRENASEEEASQESVTQKAADEKEQKLQEYLEHLEALNDPNVSELTMLGEMAFDANEPAAAYEHYLEVIEEHTDDPMAPFALYKLAWAEFNMGDVEAAIDDMELMMEWVAEEESQLHETLRSEGTRDLDFFESKAN